jgi:hypothetical protein
MCTIVVAITEGTGDDGYERRHLQRQSYRGVLLVAVLTDIDEFSEELLNHTCGR